MSDLRKSALSIAMGAVLTASAAMAQFTAPLPGIGDVQPGTPVTPSAPAQQLVCTVFSTPLTVRTEGFAELLGDVGLNCQGILQINPRNFTTTPQQHPLPQLVNISVTLSTPVTSRLTSGSMTEALVFLSDANGADPTLAAGGLTQLNQNPCPDANVNSNGACSSLVQLDGTGLANAQTPATSRPTAVGILGAVPVTVPPTTAGTQDSSAVVPVNVLQGQLQNANTVVFLGVPISQYDSSQNPNITSALNTLIFSLTPGGAFTPANYNGQPILVPFTKRFRIKNLRGAIPGAAAPNGQVFAFLSIQNPPANLQLNSASAVVGFVQQGLIFDRRNATNSGSSSGIAFAQCEDINRNLATDATSGSLGTTNNSGMILRYTEGYANSFKIRGFVPGQAPGLDQSNPTITYNSESGFYNRAFTSKNGLNQAGIADSGTRLRAAFGTVPANIRLYVTVGNVNGGANASMGAYGVVADATGGNPSPITVPVFPTSSAYSGTTTFTTFGSVLTPFTNPFAPNGGPFNGQSGTNGFVQVTLASGAGAFTWEVYSADPQNPESALFEVVAAWRFSQNPALGSATVQGSLAPVNSTAVASGFLVPIPRFQDTSTPALLFSTNSCVTNLLYPFVTNIAPFDTGIAISNTSLSNPGTGELFPNTAPATQQGACSINYFGFTGTGRGAAPAPATSGVIPPGQTLVFTLSSGGGAPFGTIPATPGFQGYIIAQCAFRYAHGYAFISDLGATQLAQGYLALVMDEAIGSRTGSASESLSN